MFTGAIGVALGNGAAGVYTNSSSLWENMHKVSAPSVCVLQKWTKWYKQEEGYKSYRNSTSTHE